MRFLADMGVSIQVVEWLREQRHEALHLREEGLREAAGSRRPPEGAGWAVPQGALALLLGRAPGILLFRWVRG